MITKLGKQKLEEQIAELQKELERTYKQRNEAAAEGDLKENSAYIFLGERALVLDLIFRIFLIFAKHTSWTCLSLQSCKAA